LPELKPEEHITLEILDSQGNNVRSFSSRADSTFLQYDGGPQAEPVLPKNKGLNRFVWNLRHTTIPGVPNVYIESSFRGHKAIPGTYSVVLKYAQMSKSTTLLIKPNPLYSTDPATYLEYDVLMTKMENEVRIMHQMTNTLYNKRLQIEKMLDILHKDQKFKDVAMTGNALVTKMKAWDEDMVQRKSKAYDDVENFPNKFTANYLFMLNHNESDLPRVNQPTLDRKKELDSEWEALKSRANELLDKSLPLFNQQLWEAGVGAVWEK
jgi:hypothetical protein